MDTQKPSSIYWRTKSGVTILRIINNPELEEIACSYDVHPRTANHLLFAKTIPYGTTEWSLTGYDPWYPVVTLPQSWGLT